MKKLSAYLFIFLAIAVKSNGQDRFVLEGTIGKYPVVMKLGKNGVTYFYKNRKQDIGLLGENPNFQKLFFKREIYDSKLEKEIVSESLSIERKSSTEWKGNWKNNKAINLPVTLKLIDTTKYDFSHVPDINFKNNENRIYGKAKLSGLSFIKDSVTMSGKYQLEWSHESMTKTQLLELKNGFAPDILQKINNLFREKSFGHINNLFACTTRGDWEGEYAAPIYGYFISPKYLSIQSVVSYECGGAHPNAGGGHFTIDATTGKEISEIDQLYWFTGKKPLAEKDAGYYTYIQERSKAIITIMTRLYPKQMKKGGSGDDCDYSDPDHWDFPEWYFTKEGLYLVPTFPHADMPCNFAEFPVIPYSVLKQYERSR